MVPPPSQAGKFKPRKPAKKIKPGASAASKGAAEETSSKPRTTRRSAASAARSGRSSGGGRGESSKTRQGGGRGGSGGRGRKKPPVPLPRGAVYFTANQPNTATASKGSKSSGASKQSKKDGASSIIVPGGTSSKGTKTAKGIIKDEEEVVVGQLDQAIGSSVTSSALDTPKNQQETTTIDDYMESDNAVTSKTSISIVATYDSDSSLEEQQQDQKRPLGGASHSNLPPPTQLPFPPCKVPVGVGGHDKNRAMYACQVETEAKTPEETTTTMDPDDPPTASPFCDVNAQLQLQQEQDSWFLWQFPTRLPAVSNVHAASVAPATAPDAVTSGSSGATDGPPTPQIVASMLDPITGMPQQQHNMQRTTSSSLVNAFDDSFRNAAPGPLGKILVYKSGKTVLVMGGRHGAPEIRLNVTEGLTCGFAQHVVAIDSDEGTFVPLGNVQKTVVVTPNIDQAFSST